MTPNDSDEQALRTELHRLYWDGEESVNQIAEDLEISKGTLYELLEPLETSISCPQCGGANLVFQHRTARDRGTLECPVCAAEVDADDVVPETESGIEAQAGATRKREGRDREDISDAPGSAAAGAAILGLAAGVALFLLIRRR